MLARIRAGSGMRACAYPFSRPSSVPSLLEEGTEAQTDSLPAGRPKVPSGNGLGHARNTRRGACQCSRARGGSSSLWETS